jgi:hypothetical protein
MFLGLEVPIIYFENSANMIGSDLSSAGRMCPDHVVFSDSAESITDFVDTFHANLRKSGGQYILVVSDMAWTSTSYVEKELFIHPFFQKIGQLVVFLPVNFGYVLYHKTPCGALQMRYDLLHLAPTFGRVN